MQSPCALGTPIDIEALCKPSPFYAEQVAKDEARLNQLKGMSREELLEERRSRLVDNIERCKEHEHTHAQIDARLDQMIAAVEAWGPPSAEHERLKEFMLEQLRISKTGDIWTRELMQREEELASLGQFDVEKMIRDAERSLEYSLKQLAEEEERQKARRLWLTQLVESVPCPFTEESPW